MVMIPCLCVVDGKRVDLMQLNWAGEHVYECPRCGRLAIIGSGYAFWFLPERFVKDYAWSADALILKEAPVCTS